MLNLLTKTKPWMVASLLVATSVFGQDANKPAAQSCAPKAKSCAPGEKAKCPQPNPPTQMCPAPAPSTSCPAWPMPVLNAAYNYPARTQTRCPWDIYSDVSFIYWQPLQDNLEIGIVGDVASGNTAATLLSGKVVDMNYDYKPGFKIGLGGFFEHDNWDLHAEYTWFHNTNSQSVALSAASTATQALYPFWGHPTFISTQVYDKASASWRMHMDIADLDIGRVYYVGTKLTFRTGLGARGAWIRQNYNVAYTNDTTFPFGVSGLHEVATINQRAQSWAVGPEVSLMTNWDLGMGFRFFGLGEADVLYTRYTRLSTSQTRQILSGSLGAGQFSSVSAKQSNPGYLRTHLDLQLGFGWGTYWDCNNWYTDIALGYDFQVFFNQNMFRHFNNSSMYGNSTSANGNLYTQGLTATFALTF